MPLSKQQIQQLLELVSSCEGDSLDCDGCFERVAEFAEAELSGRKVPEALQAVETHLRQCPCCGDEYRALVEGLRALDENEPT